MSHLRAVSTSAACLLTLTLGSTSARAQDPAAPAAPPPATAPPPVIVAPAPAGAASPRSDDGSGPDARGANNAIFVEGLGNGGLYSINYERFLSDFGIRVGFSYISVSAADATASASVTMMTFPLVGSYYLGSANHKLQLGLGATFLYVSASANSLNFIGSGSGFVPAGTGVIGYRYMPKDGGFNFGIGFTPLFAAGGFLPWGGLSLGAVF